MYGQPASADQTADWPRPAEARGSPGHDLALRDAGEPAGRGLLRASLFSTQQAARFFYLSIYLSTGEPVMQINMKFVMTKERAQAVLGRQTVPDSMGEYIAI